MPTRSAEPPAARYDAVAIALHWTIALAIVGMLGLGMYMSDLPLTPLRVRLYNGHKWAGVAILALVLARLAWRLGHPPPALPPRIAIATPAWLLATQRGVHAGLYLLMLAVPLLGWAYTSAAGFPVVWLGVLPLPDFVPVDKPFADGVLKPLHRASAWLLGALALLHAGAALKHHFVERDGLLARMWPAARAARPADAQERGP